jgi:hypothetical protein
VRDREVAIGHHRDGRDVARGDPNVKMHRRREGVNAKHTGDEMGG